LNLISGIQRRHTKSILTPLSDFSLLSEVATMWQTDGAAYKLKPRSFHKSAQLWVYLVDFHLWYKLCLTVFYFVIFVVFPSLFLFLFFWLLVIFCHMPIYAWIKISRFYIFVIVVLKLFNIYRYYNMLGH